MSQTTHTILYGWAANEGPNGEMQSGPTFMSRPETPEERDQTARYARAAFRKVGVPEQRAHVKFYGSGPTAIGHVFINGRKVIVKPEDL